MKYLLSILLIANLFSNTDEPSQINALGDWDPIPIFTVGESINNYFPPGKLDGIGALQIDTSLVRLLINHELSDDDGYLYYLSNGTGLRGSRVSFFDLNKNTFELMDANLAYHTIIDRMGEIVTSAYQINEYEAGAFDGLDRLCSSGFYHGGELGLIDDIYLTGEENDNGQAFALDPHNNILYTIPVLGRCEFENLALLELENPNLIAIVIGADTPGAPLFLYVGENDSESDNFLSRNGLSLNQGKLFALVINNANNPIDFSGTGSERSGFFQELDYYRPDLAGVQGYDSLGFASQELQYQLAEQLGAFTFSRPEDLSKNPNSSTEFVFTSTGRSSSFNGVDKWGTTYIINLDFIDIENNDIQAYINIIYDGDDAGNNQFNNSDFGLRSPDNLDWSDNGMIYIQEDAAYSLFGNVSDIEASVWELNPENGILNRIGIIDRNAIPSNQYDDDPDDFGEWESSGILDVSNEFSFTNMTLLVLDVMAASLDGGPINQYNLEQGGQLLLLKKQNYLLGDVNLDGIINILDIIATVNFILSNEYNVSADLNDDSIINVLDIIELVNIIMN